MADYKSTQRLRSFFDEDEEKKDERVTVSTPQSDNVDFSRADNSASHLKDSFADFAKSAPSRQPKPEVVEPAQPVELPRQRGEYRGNVFQKLGQSYVDVIKDVPAQTAKGLGMIHGATFGLAEKGVEAAADQLAKNDSYSQFMTDAAKGIDLGQGRAAVGILNTGVLGIGDLKPVLNTEIGKEITTNIESTTSNVPLKTVAAFRAIGEGTYKEYRDAMIEDRENPENGKVEAFLYDLQDSGVQSLLGVLITTGTVIATKNPKAGYAIGGAYYGSLSAAEQIQSEGEVTSSANIYIDVIGDSLINNALLGVFKMPAGVLARTAATAGLEGTTEVVQTLLKFSNSYLAADTDAERNDILADASYYVKSGGIITEFGIGAIVGGVAQGGVEVLNTSGAQKTYNSAKHSIENSLPFDIDSSIESGDIKATDIYSNPEQKILNKDAAQGRIQDVQQKLDLYQDGLGNKFLEKVDVNNSTYQQIVDAGLEVLETAKVDTTAGTEEVLNTAGSKKKPVDDPKVANTAGDIAEISDLIARADRGAELSVNEQTALVQARQSFVDYSNAFQTTTAIVDNTATPTGAPAAQIQTVEVGGKVAVKYSIDAGDTALQIDYDLNTLYSSPEAATKAAIESIQAYIESQKNNPNIPVVAQTRLEDTLKKLKGEDQSIPVKKKEKESTQPKDTSQIAIGTKVNFNGRPHRVTLILPVGGETKYQLTGDNGNEIYTNKAGLETAIEATKRGITEQELLDEKNRANGFDVKSKKTESKKTEKKETKKTAKTKAKKEVDVKKPVEGKKKTEDSLIQGISATPEEIFIDVRSKIEESVDEIGENIEIVDIAIVGSRLRKTARKDSDLDIVVQYNGDIREDDLFNTLNDEKLIIEGIEIDINPIKESKSGTIDDFLKNNEGDTVKESGKQVVAKKTTPTKKPVSSKKEQAGKTTIEPSRRITQLVESYVAGETQVDKLNNIPVDAQENRKKFDEIAEEVAKEERGMQSAIDQLAEETGLPVNLLLDGISFYISKDKKTITDFYNDINAEIKRLEETAEGTAAKLMVKGKPEKAEQVTANANTLTIVPANLDTEVELVTGVATRPDQKVSKTKLKGIFGKEDQVVFTVLVEDSVIDGKEVSRTYLHNKTDSSEMKLRTDALGLVPDNLTVGQEIVLKKSDLKAAGRQFKAVDEKGDVFAEPRKLNYKNKVLRKEDITETFDPTVTAGYYDAEARQSIFERRILPQLKKISTLKEDEVVVYYQPAEGESGQYVNRDLGRVWWIPQIDGDFVVKKVKESELFTTGFSERDKVGESIYFPAKTDKIAMEDKRLRDLTSGRFISTDQAKQLASTEFEKVSKLVKKAEPAGKKPSVFASREPKKDTKLGDVAMNGEELAKGSEIEYNKLAKRSEIARVLTSKLSAVVRTGKFRQAANGIYNQKTDVIRLSNKHFSTREGGQLTTLIHEIGHYLDYSTFEFRALIPKGEINPLLENYGSGANSVPANKKKSEAFAEFLRYYITLPSEAEQRAPEFFKKFETKLEELPEIRDVLQTTQREFKRWAEQPATSKVAAQISFDGKKDKGDIKGRMKTSLHTLYKMGVNDLHALDQFSNIAKQSVSELEASNDPAILARNMRGWIGRAQYFLESATVRRDFWKKSDNGKFSVEKKGKGLKEILQPVEDKGGLNDLSVYLVSRRALELHERDITSGVTKEDATIALNELEAKYPEFAQVSQDLDAYQSDLLDYLEESGVLNKDDRKKMQEANKMYVPFFRVHEELTQQGFMGGKAIPTKSPIKKIKGSERDIIDPIESIVKNTYVLINAAERNNVMLSMAKLAKENKELGRLFEPVPEDMSKVASVNPKELVYQALGADTAIGKLSLPAEVQSAIEIVVPETMVNIFRPAMFQKGNIVTILEDGKSKHYELEEDLYSAVNSMEVGEADLMVKIMSYPAQFLRAGATLAPEFMVRNPLRDSIGAAVFSKNGFIPFYDTARGFASLIKKDAYYDAFVLSGGLQSTIVAQDRTHLTKSKDELLKRSARIKKLIKNPLEVLQIMSQYTEQATRIGEARLALNAGKSTTQAAFDSREVTLDFQRAGTKTRNVNRIAAFFNAKIQGNDKLIRTFIDNPAKATLKATMYITMPSVILWFLNQDEEGYDEIPQWQKDIYWLVKVDETWYRIPKPFELGILFGSIPERFLDYLKTNDPEGLQEISRSFVTGLVPNPMPTGAIPVLENTTNYSFFLDRPIVSPSLENLPNPDQYSANTSEIAKILGDAINYSPAKIDNLLYGYFAGLGRHTVNATDAILKGTGIVNTVTEPTGTKADVPVLKAFVVRDPSGSSSNSVNDFYENRSDATKHYNKYKLLLEEGEKDKAREYLADHGDIKLYKSYNQIGGQLSDLRKLRDAVYNSEKLTAVEKREKVDELNALMTDTAYRANNIELK